MWPKEALFAQAQQPTGSQLGIEPPWAYLRNGTSLTYLSSVLQR
mgnify:CR=1 FL=1